MNNTEIYIGKNTPVNKELLWLRPLNPGVSLYGNVNGKWEPLKLIDGKGTRTVEDDEVIDVATDIYSKEEIDERFADILGLDAEGIAELKALIEDGDALTGLLGEILKKADVEDLNDKQDTINDLATIRSGAALGATAVQPSDLATVATSGSYNDLLNTPTIPDITDKADKVSNATNGNFAALDSNGNLTDSGHKNSDYQASLVSGTNIKSINGSSILSSGDLKLCKTVTFSGKTDWLWSPSNTGFIDITNGIIEYAEEKLEYITDNTTSIYALKNHYYALSNTPSSLSIYLPTSLLAAGDACGFNFTTSSSFSSFTITGGTIKKMKDFAIEASKTYEVVALYDGAKWLVTATEFE